MTLLDAYDIHVRKLHARTMRPFLGFRVVNAANSNCPHLPSLRAGATVSLSGRPTPFLSFAPFHALTSTCGNPQDHV